MRQKITFFKKILFLKYAYILQYLSDFQAFRKHLLQIVMPSSRFFTLQSVIYKHTNNRKAKKKQKTHKHLVTCGFLFLALSSQIVGIVVMHTQTLPIEVFRRPLDSVSQTNSFSAAQFDKTIHIGSQLIG